MQGSQDTISPWKANYAINNMTAPQRRIMLDSYHNPSIFGMADQRSAAGLRYVYDLVHHGKLTPLGLDVRKRMIEQVCSINDLDAITREEANHVLLLLQYAHGKIENTFRKGLSISQDMRNDCRLFSEVLNSFITQPEGKY